MEAYLETLKRSATVRDNAAQRRDPPPYASATQTKGAFKQDLGATRYTSTSTKGKAHSREKAVNAGSAGRRSSQRSTDADNEGDEDDELNLTQDSSPIGTPAKPVASYGTLFGSKRNTLPKFTKGKKPANDEDPHVILSSSSSSSDCRKSLQSKHKPSSSRAPEATATQSTVPKAPPAYRVASSQESDATPKARTIMTQTLLTDKFKVDMEATPRTRKLYDLTMEESKAGRSRDISASKSKAENVPLKAKPFPLAPKASTSASVSNPGKKPRDDEPDSSSQDKEVEVRKPQPHPMHAAILAKSGGKGKEKLKDDDEQDSSIADEKRIKNGPQPFPLAKPQERASTRSDKKRSSSSEDSPVPPKRRDSKKAQTGPQPHPMANQVLEKISQPKPPSSSSVASSSKRTSDSDHEDERAARRRRIEAALAMSEEVSILVDEDSHADPSTLCPYCDQHFPPNPSPLLESMLKRARASSYRDPRHTNSLGLKAPILVYIDVCQRHTFETEQLPLARSKGWPTAIDFEKIPERMQMFKEKLEKIILNRESSSFWGEISAEIEQGGSRKVTGIAGQFVAFDKSQPGYYGEQGSLIISQTLYSLFPLASFNASLVAPLTPAEFIQRVLVPEAAVFLIMNDMTVDRTIAIETLRESSRYGVAMFPSLDKGGAEEKIVRQRAMARRKEIEAEEILEGKSEGMVEQDTDTKRKGKGKPTRSRATNDESVVDIDGTLESDASHTSRRSTRITRQKKVANDSDVEMVDKCSGVRAPGRANALKSQPHARLRRSQSNTQGSSFASDSENTSAPRSPMRKRKPRPAYSAEATEVSDSDPDAGNVADVTPKPLPRTKSFGGAQREVYGGSATTMTANMRPLDMAKLKQAGKSSTSASSSTLKRLSSKDSEGWRKSFSSDSDDSDIVEMSQDDIKPKPKLFTSNARNVKPKDSVSWLLSSQET